MAIFTTLEEAENFKVENALHLNNCKMKRPQFMKKNKTEVIHGQQ